MDIQLFSDLHLEFSKTFPMIERKAKYLVLAGDIGRLCDKNYTDFIEYCSKTWEHIIVVLGNHEFYHNKKTYITLLSEYFDYFSQYDNVTLLEKDKIMLDGWEIIGLTMWAYIRPSYKDIMNCSKQIKTRVVTNNGVRREHIGYQGINKLYNESLEWLLNNYDPNKKTIIITHHPLTHDNISMPEYENEPSDRRDAFATDMVFQNKAPLVCMSGHTHFSHDFIKNNVRYISNQMGYKEEVITGKTKFNPGCIYTILTHDSA